MSNDEEAAVEQNFEASAFESLERDFQQVLTELVGDKSLERFRQEYEKLHRALKKSHESETRLIKKCRELNAEIISNASKVQTALKLSQEDQNTIGSLKREIEKPGRWWTHHMRRLNAQRKPSRNLRLRLPTYRASSSKALALAWAKRTPSMNSCERGMN